MKYILSVEETQTYIHNIIIETEEEINPLCDRLEREMEGLDDFNSLKGNKTRVLKITRDESPECRFDIYDYDEITDGMDIES